MAMTQEPIDWRYQSHIYIYIRPIFKAYVREYHHKIWPYMVQYLHFRILEFPLNMVIKWWCDQQSTYHWPILTPNHDALDSALDASNYFQMTSPWFHAQSSVELNPTSWDGQSPKAWTWTIALQSFPGVLATVETCHAVGVPVTRCHVDHNKGDGERTSHFYQHVWESVDGSRVSMGFWHVPHDIHACFWHGDIIALSRPHDLWMSSITRLLIVTHWNGRAEKHGFTL